MRRLTLRSRTALVIGAGFFVVSLVLLGLVALLEERALRTESADATEQLRSELGLTSDAEVDVVLTVPGGRTLPIERLNDVIAEGSETVRRDVVRGLLVLLPATALLAAAAGSWLAGRVTQPLQRIAAVAGRVSSDRLDARIGHVGPDDEVHDLAEAIDRMMERLERAFHVQGTFASAASHELRTPLTIVRTELDVALSADELDRDELADMAAAIREALDRAERTIDALLVLGRAGIVDVAQEVDVVALVESEVARLDAPTQVRVHLPPALPVAGDPVLLERLVRNLLDNALLHNDERGQVEVRVLAVPPDRVAVVVANTGPVLDREDIARLTEPFRRAVEDPRRVPGSGLGLAIVEAVVVGHRGDLRLTARDGGGLEVAVELPASG